MRREEVTIHYKSEEAIVQIMPMPRGGLKMRLEIGAKHGVRLFVPPRVTLKQARQFIEDKKPWIFRNLRKAQFQKQESEKEQRDPSKIYFLGKAYELLTSVKPDNKNTVRLDEDKQTCLLSVRSELFVKPLLLVWYNEQAINLIPPLIEKFLPLPWMKSSPPVRFRFLKSCWGKCKGCGLLTFNIHLIKAPIDCINYVIFHELCHLKEHNHSPFFWALVESQFPNRKIYEKYLKEHGRLFIED